LIKEINIYFVQYVSLSQYELIIDPLLGYDDFSVLVEYFKTYHHAKILSEYDGFVRDCILKVDEVVIGVHHCDLFGNYISAPSNEGQKKLSEIAYQLHKYFIIVDNSLCYTLCKNASWFKLLLLRLLRPAILFRLNIISRK